MIRNFNKLFFNNFKTGKRAMSTACDSVGINTLGINNPTTIHHNLSYPELFQHEKENNEGSVINAKYGKTYLLTRQINEYSPNEDSSFTTLTPKTINKSSITFGYHIYITYNNNNTKNNIDITI